MMWAVLPLIKPWAGDIRRNHQPYYIGQGMGWLEYVQAQSAKLELERRGIPCYTYLMESD